NSTMKRAQLALRQVSNFPVLVNLFKVDEETAVSVSRGDKEIDDRMPGDLNVDVERVAGVSEKLLVFFGTIPINNLAASLCVPTILRPRSSIEIDRVAIRT